jgi:hypothetical protein
LQKGYLKNLIIVTGFDVGPGQQRLVLILLDLHRREGALNISSWIGDWSLMPIWPLKKGQLATPWFVLVANTCILGVLEKPGDGFIGSPNRSEIFSHPSGDTSDNGDKN